MHKTAGLVRDRWRWGDDGSPTEVRRGRGSRCGCAHSLDAETFAGGVVVQGWDDEILNARLEIQKMDFIFVRD